MDYFFSTVIRKSFSLYRMLIDGLWLIVMFLSVIWTLFLMAPIHCRGSIVSKLISQNLFRRNKHLSILDGLRVSQFSFWVNNFFNRNFLYTERWDERWDVLLRREVRQTPFRYDHVCSAGWIWLNRLMHHAHYLSPEDKWSSILL